MQNNGAVQVISRPWKFVYVVILMIGCFFTLSTTDCEVDPAALLDPNAPDGALNDQDNGKVLGPVPPPKEEIFDTDAMGRKQGHWIHRTSDGTKLREGSYTDDKEDGKWTLFHPNGRKKEEGSYILGKKTGTWNKWNSGGKIRRSTGYVDGNEEGADTFYSPAGELSRVVHKLDGKLHGAFTTYFPSGRVEGEASYTRGEKTGTETQYADNDAHAKIGGGMWVAGKKEGMWIDPVFDFQDRRHAGSNEGNYVDGLKQGRWTFIHDSDTAETILEYDCVNGDGGPQNARDPKAGCTPVME